MPIKTILATILFSLTTACVVDTTPFEGGDDTSTVDDSKIDDGVDNLGNSDEGAQQAVIDDLDDINPGSRSGVAPSRLPGQPPAPGDLDDMNPGSRSPAYNRPPGMPQEYGTNGLGSSDASPGRVHSSPSGNEHAGSYPLGPTAGEASQEPDGDDTIECHGRECFETDRPRHAD